jgi:hypothetical protein
VMMIHLQLWALLCPLCRFDSPKLLQPLSSGPSPSVSVSLSQRELCVCVCVCVCVSLSPSSTLSLSAAAGPTAAVITSYSPSSPGPPNSAPTDQQLSACHHQPSLKCLNSFVCPMICHTQ